MCQGQTMSKERAASFVTPVESNKAANKGGASIRWQGEEGPLRRLGFRLLGGATTVEEGITSDFHPWG